MGLSDAQIICLIIILAAIICIIIAAINENNNKSCDMNMYWCGGASLIFGIVALVIVTMRKK